MSTRLYSEEEAEKSEEESSSEEEEEDSDEESSDDEEGGKTGASKFLKGDASDEETDEEDVRSDQCAIRMVVRALTRSAESHHRQECEGQEVCGLRI